MHDKPMRGSFKPLGFINYKEATPYQWDIISIDDNAEIDQVVEIMLDLFLENVYLYLKTDFSANLMAQSNVEKLKITNKNKLYRDLISGDLYFDLLRRNHDKIIPDKDSNELHFISLKIKDLHLNQEDIVAA